jgi:hypothetical protein
MHKLLRKAKEIKMNRIKILTIVLLFYSCKNYSVHEKNLMEQNKSMMKYDKKSISNQQKIRSKRKKSTRNKKFRTRFFKCRYCTTGQYFRKFKKNRIRL